MMPRSTRSSARLPMPPDPGPAEGRTDLDVSPAATGYAWKRTIDIVLALVLFIPTAPIILACLLLVRLTSRGPGIYSQRRVGLRGRVFWMHKVRTMYDDCERLSGPRWS